MNNKQKKEYLDSRGGRTLSDVMRDSKGEYVVMWSGERGKEVKVYLPSNKKSITINKQ